MKRLSAQDRRSRLAYDARICARLSSPNLVLTGHTTIDAMQAGRVATEAEGEAGRVECYGARFLFPVLTGPGPTTPSITLAFLLTADTYPYSDPFVTVVSRPLPWNPHVSASGTVCIGEAWRNSHGHMLVAQLVTHLMRVLNLDEPDRGPGYVGWNGAAITYWRAALKCQPLNPRVVYPVLPEDLTHGIKQEAPMFVRRVPTAPSPPAAPAAVGFRPRLPAEGGLFRAVPQGATASPTFRARRGSHE